MRARFTKLAAALAALAALAVGGSAIASAGSKANAPAPPAVTQPQQDVTSSVDGDNVQQGDQSAPDTAQPSETATEQAGSESEQASESGPSDGPGGYADTNANADTQQVGEH
jgi:hypothetical protein